MRKTSGRRIVATVLTTVMACFALVCGAAGAQGAVQPAGQPADAAAIQTVIDAQVAAWNRGDIDSFMSSYEDSPETTFVGSDTVRKGFQPILERYKKGYANADQMGKLSFSDLEIRLLPSAAGKPEYAVATGHFHLERTAKGSATKDDGIFSLVWHKSSGKWKIVLDHTS